MPYFDDVISSIISKSQDLENFSDDMIQTEIKDLKDKFYDDD